MLCFEDSDIGLDIDIGLEFDIDVEFDEFKPLLIVDFWSGSSLMMRISPKLNTDVLSLSYDLNQYKLIGAAGTWKYRRSFFP